MMFVVIERNAPQEVTTYKVLNGIWGCVWNPPWCHHPLPGRPNGRPM